MKHRRKYGAGLLVAAMLGVMAFAASAQAITELESGFFINEVQAGALLATATAKQVGAGKLLVPALSTTITCQKFSLVNAAVESTKDATGTLLYEECTVLTSAGAENTPCHIVVNHTGDKKLHITATALLLPAELTDGTPAILAENIVAKVLMEEGTECTLPKTTNITGELCLKVDKNHTSEPELLASDAIQKSCNPRLTLNGTEFSGTLAEREKLEAEGKGFLDLLLFGINPATVDGTAIVLLTGAHKDFKLGVLLI